MSTSGAFDSNLHDLEAKIAASLQSDSPDVWKDLRYTADALLTPARSDGSDDDANRAWYLREVSANRYEYLCGFQLMQSGKFYQAWCKLEQVEIALISILRNQFYPPARFAVEQLATMVKNWQTLFPYAVFLSPEFAIKREECTICGLTVGPWSTCRHQAGVVYRGQECLRIVKDVKFLGLSLVRDPVQKYSVPFMRNAQGEQYDQYDYTVVKFVVDRLRSAISGWTPRWTNAYHPHKLFKDVLPKDGCPCRSGRQYGQCCKPLPGVLRPHIDLVFDDAPSVALPNIAFTGYGRR
jgi:hypothetical protein